MSPEHVGIVRDATVNAHAPLMERHSLDDVVREQTAPVEQRYCVSFLSDDAKPIEHDVKECFDHRLAHINE